MGDAVLTPERILEAAEDVLRRFGPEKATVVDVARSLGVTHGSVYRHFASKAALRDAVVRRWLAAMMPPLEAVAAEQGRPRAAPALAGSPDRGQAEAPADDPELFATYFALAAQARRSSRPTSMPWWARRPGSSPTAWPAASSPRPIPRRAGRSSTRRPGSTARRTRPSGPIPASARPSTRSGTSSRPAWRRGPSKGARTGPRPGRVASRGSSACSVDGFTE